MKLIKDINIKAYEVLVDYKVKVTSSPFIAILKFADENGGEVDSNTLYNDLLQPLSQKACENILERLTTMGYFDKNDDSYDDDDFPQRPLHDSSIVYSLTELGNTSAQREEFYEDRHGILKMYLADSQFINQRVVKIEEISRQDSFEEKHLKHIRQPDLNSLLNSDQHLTLENGTFILSSFKEKCRAFNDERKQLTLQTNDTDSEIILMDFKNTIQKNSKEVRNEILTNEFERDYLVKEQLLRTDFNPKYLELQRNIEVQRPVISDIDFKPIEIKNIKLSPKNSSEAREWFKALVAQNINIYFLSKVVFMEFTNTIAQEFELFNKELKNSIIKEDIIQELDKEKDFYKRAKLETIDYLNY